MNHPHTPAFHSLVLMAFTIGSVSAYPLQPRATGTASRTGQQEEEEGGVVRQAIGTADRNRILVVVGVAGERSSCRAILSEYKRLISVVLLGGLAAGYFYFRKRKRSRESEAARVADDARAGELDQWQLQHAAAAEQGEKYLRQQKKEKEAKENDRAAAIARALLKTR